MELKEKTLDGRVVLIAGAGGALGAAAAEHCAGRGARLVLLGRTQHKLEAIYDRIAQRSLPLPFLCPLDLATADANTFQQLAASLAQEFGTLHGLLHAAAERGTPGPVADIEPAEWERVLRVNLSAPLLLTRALLPLLGASDGSVLFVTDRTGGPAFKGAYGVAKQGVENLAQTLAAEWAASGRLRVNILSPRPFLSPLRRRAYPGEHPEQLARAEDYAPLISDILGPACRANGEIFPSSATT
jgi:NAD(P)-dependent dehydrogenase (short-subunit alcohol dehydrogenase family)